MHACASTHTHTHSLSPVYNKTSANRFNTSTNKKKKKKKNSETLEGDFVDLKMTVIARRFDAQRHHQTTTLFCFLLLRLSRQGRSSGKYKVYLPEDRPCRETLSSKKQKSVL